MKKLILSAIILILLTGTQNLFGQISVSKNEPLDIRMQKTITDAAIGSKTITSAGEITEQPAAYYLTENMIKAPEINWQYTDPASIVSGVKVSVNTQNTFVGWELNYERVSLYKDSSTPLWERSVVSDWDFRVDMTEDGSVMVYGANNLVEVFEPPSSTPVWDISFNANIDGVALSPDGSLVYIAAENYNSTGFTHIFCYTIGTNQPNWETQIEGGAENLILSGDGSTLVFSQYGAILVIDTEDGVIIFEDISQNQYPPTVSYNGSLIINGDYSGFAHLYEYDTVNSTYYKKWDFHVGGGGTSAWVVGMGISGDGTTVAIGTLVFLSGGGVDGEIYLFNSYSPVPVWVYEHAGDLVQSIDLSYDGSIIAAAGWGPLDHSKPDFFLFRRNTNEPIFSINTPGSMYYTDISPDGTLCAVGGKAVHARIMGSGGILYNVKSDPGGGTVAGIIDLENNDNNSGARIEIPELDDYFDYSDVDGSYAIQYVPAGTYPVVASKVGYYPVTEEDVIVVEGEVTNVDFNLLLTGNPPENLFATNGAGLTVDLFWDPPEEKYYTGFNIYCKLYPENMFPDEPIGSVSAGELTFSDGTALPTKTYYYAVTCILDGGLQSPYSNIETGWISTGFVTNEISVYHGSTPVIDGTISEGEWDDAFKIDCSDFLGTHDNTVNPIGSVIGYFKSNPDNTELYVAYINYNDTVLEDHDEVALYIDDNNDGSFPPPEDLSEGNFWAAHYASGDVIKYRPIFNTGGVGTVIYLDNPQIAVSDATGCIVYEFVIPIGTEDWELNPGPEEKSSLAIFVLDDPTGFDGWWPLDNPKLFVPTNYGTLTLSAIDEIPPPPDNISISNIENTAIIEWDMPPINDFDHFNIYYDFTSEFTLLDSTLGVQFLYEMLEIGYYQFYITTVDYSGQESDPSEIVDINWPVSIDKCFVLNDVKAYPNPFSNHINIEFYINEKSSVILEVYNIMGTKVRTLLNSRLDKNKYSIQWDGTNAAGSSLENGLYFYKLSASDYTYTGKMVMFR